jgi:hypothetical protein
MGQSGDGCAEGSVKRPKHNCGPSCKCPCHHVPGHTPDAFNRRNVKVRLEGKVYRAIRAIDPDVGGFLAALAMDAVVQIERTAAELKAIRGHS